MMFSDTELAERLLLNARAAQDQPGEQSALEERMSEGVVALEDFYLKAPEAAPPADEDLGAEQAAVPDDDNGQSLLQRVSANVDVLDEFCLKAQDAAAVLPAGEEIIAEQAFVDPSCSAMPAPFADWMPVVLEGDEARDVAVPQAPSEADTDPPDDPDDPDGSDGSEPPFSPSEAEVPSEPEEPRAPGALGALEVPVEPGAPGAPRAPEASEAPEAPEAPEALVALGALGAPEAPEALDALGAPGALWAPGVAQAAPEGLEAPKVPEVPEGLEAPEGAHGQEGAEAFADVEEPEEPEGQERLDLPPIDAEESWPDLAPCEDALLDEAGGVEHAALALPVDVGADSAEVAASLRAQRRAAAASRKRKEELTPRLQCLQDLLKEPLGTDYEDLIKRLTKHALTHAPPSVDPSAVSRTPVSFKMKISGVSAPKGAKAKSRAPAGPRVTAGNQAKEADSTSPVVVAEKEAPLEPGAEAYGSRTAPVALLRAYVSEGRWIGSHKGSIIFEDDGVQYPGSTLTPIREQEDGGALLNLSSLWLLSVLQGRYEAASTQRICQSHGAVRIAKGQVQGLLKFLLGKEDECKLLVPSSRLSAVPPPVPSQRKRPRPLAPGVHPPLGQRALNRLPGCEVASSIADLVQAVARGESSLHSIELELQKVAEARKALEEKMAAELAKAEALTRAKAKQVIELQSLKKDLAAAQGQSKRQKKK